MGEYSHVVISFSPTVKLPADVREALVGLLGSPVVDDTTGLLFDKPAVKWYDNGGDERPSRVMTFIEDLDFDAYHFVQLTADGWVNTHGFRADLFNVRTVKRISIDGK